MYNAENVDKNSQQGLEKTSLSGGMEILPGMRSEKLYFKPIIYPEVWDQCKGSEINILNMYLLEIVNTGTANPRKLYNISHELSEGLDMDAFYYETNQTYSDSPYHIIMPMINARILEQGIWEAKFVIWNFISNRQSILEPLVNCLNYNESPVPPQMLPVAALYIDLLHAIKNNDVETTLICTPGIREMYRDHPQMVSAMVEDIKSAPLPTTNYFSWAFEKASNNLEAQKNWPLYSK